MNKDFVFGYVYTASKSEIMLLSRLNHGLNVILDEVVSCDQCKDPNRETITFDDEHQTVTILVEGSINAPFLEKLTETLTSVSKNVYRYGDLIDRMDELYDDEDSFGVITITTSDGRKMFYERHMT